ncbi:cysteine desulfurase [Ramlibacter tataouinensis]|uniref:Cysteine desulfurase n=2 Tax=Ramlibacter tataouinensis TaxID=94132 RepID=A0A127JX08_9BURK|nr:cysteine desulfurase [Ramlibacter tataouinensis]
MLQAATLAADFPGLAQGVNGEPLAYLDNAATTHMPRPVQDAMRAFETRSRANIHRGVHTLSQRSTEAFEQARATLKRFVGAGAQHELVFTSGTTEALNLVAHGLSDAGQDGPVLQPGDDIVVTALEHHANLVPWQLAARRSGARLLVLRPDRQGRLHIDELAPLLSPRTRVFAVTACANATGERPPYEALMALAAEAGALTVLDAAQAMAHEVPLLSQLPCDFMAFSGHKMYGPMGIGALVGRRPALERLTPLRLGGDMVEWVSETSASFAALPARLEGGTPHVAGAVGMAAAADYMDAIGLEAIDAHVRALRAHAVAGLSALPGLTVLSPDAGRSAIVSFVAAAAHPHDLGTLLDERGIAVRTGNHCAQPLLEWLGVGPTTRASFALYNTHDEVERLIDGVAFALEVLK